MSELPCVGAGITVVDPGPSSDEVWRKRKDGRPSTPKKRRSSRASWHDTPLRLLRAFVTNAGCPPDARDTLGAEIQWKCGIRYGRVFSISEGTEWVRGHGPQARGALLAARVLEQQR